MTMMLRLILVLLTFLGSQTIALGQIDVYCDATNKVSIWSPGKTGNAVENAFGHFKKHGSEFLEFQNSKQYVEGAKKFFSDPPSGALTKTRASGDKLFYDPPSNTFGVQAADGAPKTMFRPDKGIDYWNKK